MFRTFGFFRIDGRSKIRIQFKRFNSNTPEALTPLTYKQIKNAILKRSLFVKVSTAAIILGGIGVIMSYVHGWEDTPERQLAKALNNLHYDDVQYKIEGFNILNEKLFVTKRVFSGEVAIPVGVENLVREDVVSSLVNNVPVAEVRGHALSWIYKLVSYSPFASYYLLLSDPNLDKVCTVLIQTDYSSTTDWILASHILLNMEKHKEAFVKNVTFLIGLESMAYSNNPLAVSTASRLFTLLTPDVSINSELSSNLAKLNQNSITSSITKIALNHVPEYVHYPHLTDHHNLPASLVSTLVFSTFASVWGKLLWSASISMSSEYKALVKGHDPKQVKSLRKQFLRHRAVGRAVFALLLFDYVASNLMTHTSGERLAFQKNSPLQLPSNLSKKSIPLSSLYPVVQTSLFLLGSLIALHTQRFVVVPLLLAGGFYNMDLVKQVPVLDKTFGLYVRELEQYVDDIDRKLFHFIDKLSGDL